MNLLDERILRRAAVVRALVETLVLLAVLAAVLLLVKGLPPASKWGGLALSLAVSGGPYFGVRRVLPGGGRLRQIAAEFLSAVCLAAVLLGANLILVGVVRPDGNPADVWANIALSLALGVLLYLGVRLGLRLWLYWQGLCRRRMAWALTRAQLSLIVWGAVLATVLLALLASADLFFRPQVEARLLAARLLDTLVVAVGGVTLVTCPALLLLLPVFALFSYGFARRTTRRLEDLAQAADALRQKDYRRRVPLDGEDEVARLQHSFNDMASELEHTLLELQSERDKVAQLLEERRALFASVSHELRTPVAVLRSGLETVRASAQLPADAQLAQDLSTLEHQTVQLQRLLDDLFTLARVEVRQFELACRSVTLAPLVPAVVQQFAAWAWDTGRVELVYQDAGEPLTVLADPTRLEQVLANLVRNAVRFTEPGGLVVVQTGRTADAVQIQVRDTGCGIAAADLEHIWARFYRTGQEAQEANAGLGLPLVKEFIEAMGGTVAVESRPGEGSCFTLTLPPA